MPPRRRSSLSHLRPGLADHARFAKIFAAERARLLAALGPVTQGGQIDSLQHIISTYLPGARGSGVVDLAAAVWPFPVADAALAALRRLGYRPLPAPAGAQEQPATLQRFRHARQAVQLWCYELGSDAWQDALTVRDYLAHLGPAAPPPTPNHTRHFQRLLPRANAWWVARHGFSPVEELVAELAGFDRPWHIASGWAIDLFLGQVGRVHHDIDVEVARDDQLALRAHLEARGWTFVTPYHRQLEPRPPDTRLEGVRHQAHAHRGERFIDCLFTNMTPALWTYRRQPEVVRLMPRAQLRTPAGVPYLAPELVLLFKSKSTAANGHPRRQDAADFERAAPQLEPERRAWLRWALTAAAPHHPWIKRLA